jgi:hypothetical protein
MLFCPEVKKVTINDHNEIFDYNRFPQIPSGNEIFHTEFECLNHQTHETKKKEIHSFIFC